MSSDLENLRRTLGRVAIVGLALPVLAQLAAPLIPLIVVLWAILSFGSILTYGHWPPDRHG